MSKEIIGRAAPEPDNQVHVDLETMDTESSAKILSIGAVFNEETFYCEIAVGEYPVTAQEMQRSLFTESKSTREWWAKHGGFVPSVEAISPAQAIHNFALWFITVTGDISDVQVWANSPSFDCKILEHHFRFYGVHMPWKFYQEQDVRTIKRLAKRLHLGLDMKANDHNALRDAQNQHRFVQRVTRKLAGLIEVARNVQETEYQLETPANGS